MSTSDVTVMSLVTCTKREDVCASVIPFVRLALCQLGLEHKRLPMTQNQIEWSVSGSGRVTVVLDRVGASCLIVIATRGLAPAICVSVAAALCRDFEAHTLLCDGTHPVDRAAFARAGGPEMVTLPARRTEDCRPRPRPLDLADTELFEVETRRAKTAPTRLAAWALSLATAVIAAPLAIPLIVHNLVRGEDLRAAALALGVAGLYSGLAQSGLAPALAGLL